MKWIPFSVLAVILAFSDRDVTVMVVCTILCFVSYLLALHGDNQIVLFLSALTREIIVFNNTKGR